MHDVVEAYAALATMGVNGEIYNICFGADAILRDIINELCEIAGVDVLIQVASDRLRANEQRRVRGSCEHLHAHTGWRPQISLTQLLKDTSAYWHSREVI